jgi:hypothetical protein
LRQRAEVRLRRLDPLADLLGSVVGVDVARIVFADRERQLDVAARDLVRGVGRPGARRRRCAGAERRRGGAEDGEDDAAGAAAAFGHDGLRRSTVGREA